MNNINFAELMPLITALSENPAALNMISALMNGSTQSASPPSPPPPPDSGKPDNGELFSKLMSVMGNSQNKSKPETKALPSAVSSIFGSNEEIKNRMVLLNAVRPYLSEERRNRLEAVIKLLRLAELGTLGSLLGGS